MSNHQETNGVAKPTEEMILFCPACGHVGDVADNYISCCPDGGNARLFPKYSAGLLKESFALLFGRVKRESTHQQPSMPDTLRQHVEKMVCLLENREWADLFTSLNSGDELAQRLEIAINDLVGAAQKPAVPDGIEQDAARYQALRKSFIAPEDTPLCYAIENEMHNMMTMIVSEQGEEAYPTEAEFDSMIDRAMLTAKKAGV
ncbi:hypothetical protein LIN78_02045 [Leeia sp. TBRC 13508]|uniref:Uncharacterized protein n=1 Tax=Leeia speluncae TaxID=2884804 RepID=A0ABS8D2D7_9NEIS|nr:hypothetical protein [Leeia speluncae]MCB6182337.1 hypothetical protein [Leeia speluncae]